MENKFSKYLNKRLDEADVIGKEDLSVTTNMSGEEDLKYTKQKVIELQKIVGNIPIGLLLTTVADSMEKVAVSLDLDADFTDSKPYKVVSKLLKDIVKQKNLETEW